VAGGVVVFLLLAPGTLERERGVLETRLRAAVEDHDRQEFARQLQLALPAHPREPAFPILAAVEALGQRDPAAGRFINRAMQVAPNWAAPHLLAVQWLWGLGRPGQALIELREALQRDSVSGGELLCSVLRAVPERWSDAVPERAPERIDAMNRMSECFALSSKTARAIDAHLLAEQPGHALAVRREARRRLKANDPEAALAVLRPLLSAPRVNGQAVAVAARALLGLGRAEELQQLLAGVRDHVDDPTALLEVEARAAAAVGDADGMRRAMARLRARALESGGSTTPGYLAQAQLEVQLGETKRALDLLDHAYRISNDTRLLRRSADLAKRAGETERARAAYRRLCARSPSDRSACEAASKSP
jgi:tetratricopeptide (TPR) repeat protein